MDTQINKMEGYTNISLPKDLAEKIDKIIQKSKKGYKTRSEFVKDAVRRLLDAT